jgi:hypothetical protein
LLSLCRKFLKKLGDNDRFVFGLKEYAEKYGLLDSFKKLDQTCIEWRQKKRPDSSSDQAVLITSLITSD